MNFARAPIVNETDVIAALDSGHLHAYICDFPSSALKDASARDHAAAPRRLDR